MFVALRLLIPTVERKENPHACAFFTNDRNRFAHVYHRSADKTVDVYCRGNVNIAPKQTGELQFERRHGQEGWEKEFPDHAKITIGQAGAIARYLFDTAYPLATRKGRKRASTNAAILAKANDLEEPNLPTRALVSISRIVRDTKASRELKELYGHLCQICCTPVSLFGKNYCEAHHIRPLGDNHNGTDDWGNMLCVCPNCHVQLDYAAIQLDPEILKSKLHPRHSINQENINYHNGLNRKGSSESK